MKPVKILYTDYNYDMPSWSKSYVSSGDTKVLHSFSISPGKAALAIFKFIATTGDASINDLSDRTEYYLLSNDVSTIGNISLSTTGISYTNSGNYSVDIVMMGVVYEVDI